MRASCDELLSNPCNISVFCTVARYLQVRMSISGKSSVSKSVYCGTVNHRKVGSVNQIEFTNRVVSYGRVFQLSTEDDINCVMSLPDLESKFSCSLGNFRWTIGKRKPFPPISLLININILANLNKWAYYLMQEWDLAIYGKAASRTSEISLLMIITSRLKFISLLLLLFGNCGLIFFVYGDFILSAKNNLSCIDSLEKIYKHQYG